jgi:hypothetical protein
MYTDRARRLVGDCRAGPLGEEGDGGAWLELRRRLLEVERAALTDLRHDGSVPLGAIFEVERDLDLEEARLERGPVMASA